MVRASHGGRRMTAESRGEYLIHGGLVLLGVVGAVAAVLLGAILVWLVGVVVIDVTGVVALPATAYDNAVSFGEMVAVPTPFAAAVVGVAAVMVVMYVVGVAVNVLPPRLAQWRDYLRGDRGDQR